MPYILPVDRVQYNDEIKSLVEKFLENDSNPGDINYVFSSILKKLFLAHPRYSEANKLMGILSCVSFEFYRMLAAPLENEKKDINGDI